MGLPQLKPNRYFKHTDNLFDYQHTGIDYMLSMPRVIQGDTTGLGKTIMAIGAMTHLFCLDTSLRCLILTEKLAVFQWEYEIAKWTDQRIASKICAVPMAYDSRHDIFCYDKTKVIISTHSMLLKHGDDMLQGFNNFILILDEASIFKNRKNKLYKSAEPLSEKAKYVYALTASVLDNNLGETYAIMRLTDPYKSPSPSYFWNNYCTKKKLFSRSIVSGYKNIRHFREYLNKFYIRRSEDDKSVKLSLPKMTARKFEIDLNQHESTIYEGLLLETIELPDDAKYSQILSKFVKQQQLLIDQRILQYVSRGTRFEFLESLLTGELKDKKLLIYSKYRKALELLEKDLDYYQYPVRKITGQDSATKRRKVQKFFQEELDGPGVLLITDAAAKAINLQKGEAIIFLDLPWSYGKLKQLIGRIRRTGSKYDVIEVIYLLGKFTSAIIKTRNTLDDYIYATLLRKRDYYRQLHHDNYDEVKEGKLQNFVQEMFKMIKESYELEEEE